MCQCRSYDCQVCPRGPMDKASAYEAGDCGFESRRRLSFYIYTPTHPKITGSNPSHALLVAPFSQTLISRPNMSYILLEYTDIQHNWIDSYTIVLISRSTALLPDPMWTSYITTWFTLLHLPSPTWCNIKHHLINPIKYNVLWHTTLSHNKEHLDTRIVVLSYISMNVWTHSKWSTKASLVLFGCLLEDEPVVVSFISGGLCSTIICSDIVSSKLSRLTYVQWMFEKTFFKP